jgi:hypothetical protein
MEVILVDDRDFLRGPGVRREKKEKKEEKTNRYFHARFLSGLEIFCNKVPISK